MPLCSRQLSGVHFAATMSLPKDVKIGAAPTLRKGVTQVYSCGRGARVDFAVLGQELSCIDVVPTPVCPEPVEPEAGAANGLTSNQKKVEGFDKLSPNGWEKSGWDCAPHF